MKGIEKLVSCFYSVIVDLGNVRRILEKRVSSLIQIFGLKHLEPWRDMTDR